MARLELRRDQLAKYRRLKFGPKDITDAGFAKLIRVHPAQVSRVLSGGAAPGTKFIAGVMNLFGVENFADLFAVDPDDA